MSEKYLTGEGPPIDRAAHTDLCGCGEVAIVRLNVEWLCVPCFDRQLRKMFSSFKALMEEGNDGEN